MKVFTERKEKRNRVTVLARLPRQVDEKMFKKDIQKVIRKWNHLLDGGVGLELVIISSVQRNL